MSSENQNLISLSGLVQLFGYTRDHLAYLCRTGQVPAQKFGRSWKTTYEAVARYEKDIGSTQKARWEEMSAKQSLTGRIPAVPVQITTVSLNWDRILAGGLYRAGESFAIALRVFALPVKGLLILTVAAVQTVRAIFGLPNLSRNFLRHLGRYYELATRPVPEVYEKYGEEFSLYRLTRTARISKFSFASAFAAITILIWTGVVTAGFGVSTQEVGLQVASMIKPIVYSILPNSLQSETLNRIAGQFESVQKASREVNELKKQGRLPAVPQPAISRKLSARSFIGMLYKSEFLVPLVLSVPREFRDRPGLKDPKARRARSPARQPKAPRFFLRRLIQLQFIWWCQIPRQIPIRAVWRGVSNISRLAS